MVVCSLNTEMTGNPVLLKIELYDRLQPWSFLAWPLFKPGAGSGIHLLCGYGFRFLAVRQFSAGMVSEL